MLKKRKRKALTDREIAGFLKISHSYVSMFNKGSRHLPIDAYPRYARLTIALGKNDGKPSPAISQELEKIHDEDKTMLEQECIVISGQLCLVSVQLKKTTEKYEHAAQVLNAIPSLRKNMETGERGDYEEQWLFVTEAEQLKKLADNSAGIQQMLTARKVGLETQLATLKSLLSSYTVRSVKKQSGKKIDRTAVHLLH